MRLFKKKLKGVAESPAAPVQSFPETPEEKLKVLEDYIGSWFLMMENDSHNWNTRGLLIQYAAEVGSIMYAVEQLKKRRLG